MILMVSRVKMSSKSYLRIINMALSLSLPLLVNRIDGFSTFSESDLIDAIKQNMKMLLLTNPGELLFNAEAGCGLDRFLFELESQELANTVKSTILQQFSIYLPYVVITSLDVTLDPESNSMRISYVFDVDRLITQETFAIEVFA